MSLKLGTISLSALIDFSIVFSAKTWNEIDLGREVLKFARRANRNQHMSLLDGVAARDRAEMR